MATRAELNALLDRYYAAPQTRVKVSGRRRLNLLIAGEGEPTVIFAPGGGASTLEWMLVQHPIAAKTRTVAYDNAGFGFSDPGPLPRTGSATVSDLRAALKAAHLAPPYVLVGWSLGGLIMRLFAFHYPREVVGMVLVDSSTEHQDRRFFEVTGDPTFNPKSREAREHRRKWLRVEQMARAGALAAGTPEYDEFVGPPTPVLTDATNAARLAQLTAPGRYRAFRSEMANVMTATSDEVDAVRAPLGDMPLIMLTAGLAPPALNDKAEVFHQVLCTMHDEFAALSTRGVRRTVEGAGHDIQIEKPELVIAAIEEVLALARGR